MNVYFSSNNDLLQYGYSCIDFIGTSQEEADVSFLRHEFHVKLDISGVFYLDITPLLRQIMPSNEVFPLLINGIEVARKRVIGYMPVDLWHHPPYNIAKNDILYPPTKSYAKRGERYFVNAVYPSFDYPITLHRGMEFETAYLLLNTYFIDNTDYAYSVGSYPNNMIDYRPTIVEDCDNLILISWKSMFGGFRRHYFKLLGTEIQSKSSRPLLNIYSQIGDITRDTVAIYHVMMDDLDEYDYWYYSDIFNALKINIDVFNSDFISATIKGTQQDCTFNHVGGTRTLKFDLQLHNAFVV